MKTEGSPVLFPSLFSPAERLPFCSWVLETPLIKEMLQSFLKQASHILSQGLYCRLKLSRAKGGGAILPRGEHIVVECRVSQQLIAVLIPVKLAAALQPNDESGIVTELARRIVSSKTLIPRLPLRIAAVYSRDAAPEAAAAVDSLHRSGRNEEYAQLAVAVEFNGGSFTVLVLIEQALCLRMQCYARCGEIPNYRLPLLERILLKGLLQLRWDTQSCYPWLELKAGERLLLKKHGSPFLKKDVSLRLSISSENSAAEDGRVVKPLLLRKSNSGRLLLQLEETSREFNRDALAKAA